MGMQPAYLRPRARTLTRIRLPLDTVPLNTVPLDTFSPDTTRLSLPQVKPRHARRAPEIADAMQINGCLSTLSMPFVQRSDFKNAAAEFFELRQCKLPLEPNHAEARVLPTYYSMADIEAAAEVLDALPTRQHIDDDLIEACGYFGWLT